MDFAQAIPGGQFFLYSFKFSGLVYNILKAISRLAIRIYLRKVIIDKPEFLASKGPLLLCCNHPNSFLDGIILDTLFNQPLYALARGDVFKKSWVRKLLATVNLLPVYRSSEGAAHLNGNYDTFRSCHRIFQQNGIVIIFSEGRCINEWHLRPLKKGTARLAISSWEQGIPLTVLPVGINYSSFRRFGKNVFIHVGEPIVASQLLNTGSDGMQNLRFNELLEGQLRNLVYEIPRNDLALQKQKLAITVTPIKRILLCVPAVIGYIFHAPLYIPVQSFTFRKTNSNDHYDSVMVAILFFAYPVYLFLITAVLFFTTHSYYSFLALLVLPFTAWAYVQLKPQLDKINAL